MKNPCNPVFSNEQFYSEFRAKFSIWVPSLRTLDGTDFTDDQGFISKMRQQEAEKKLSLAQLASIPEEGKRVATGEKQGSGGPLFPQSMDKSIKAQAGKTAFAYNQKAHKKITSHRSLVDRILKSHSEGNRFIRNDDL